MKEVTIEDMFDNWLRKFESDVPKEECFSDETKELMRTAYIAGFDKSSEFDWHN